LRGEGTERDRDAGISAVKRAADLMRSAAKRGVRIAALELSRLLLTGKEVRKNAVEAAFWSRQNAEAGFVPSMVIYGFLLEMGTGVPRDFAAAYSWYQKALAKGRRDIHDRIGRLY